MKILPSYQKPKKAFWARHLSSFALASLGLLLVGSHVQAASYYLVLPAKSSSHAPGGGGGGGGATPPVGESPSNGEDEDDDKDDSTGGLEPNMASIDFGWVDPSYDKLFITLVATNTTDETLTGVGMDFVNGDPFWNEGALVCPNGTPGLGEHTGVLEPGQSCSVQVGIVVDTGEPQEDQLMIYSDQTGRTLIPVVARANAYHLLVENGLGNKVDRYATLPGSAGGQTLNFVVKNVGNQPLVLNQVTLLNEGTWPNAPPVPSDLITLLGSTSCASAMQLAGGTQCRVDINIAPGGPLSTFMLKIERDGDWNDSLHGFKDFNIRIQPPN